MIDIFLSKYILHMKDSRGAENRTQLVFIENLSWFRETLHYINSFKPYFCNHTTDMIITKLDYLSQLITL